MFLYFDISYGISALLQEIMNYCRHWSPFRKLIYPLIMLTMLHAYQKHLCRLTSKINTFYDKQGSVYIYSESNQNLLYQVIAIFYVLIICNYEGITLNGIFHNLSSQ